MGLLDSCLSIKAKVMAEDEKSVEADLSENERRSRKEIELLQLQADLTMAQKVALSEVGHYGYDLAFVRNTPMGKLAIVMVNGKVMTIDDEGEIEPQPTITIRD